MFLLWLGSGGSFVGDYICSKVVPLPLVVCVCLLAKEETGWGVLPLRRLLLPFSFAVALVKRQIPTHPKHQTLLCPQIR